MQYFKNKKRHEELLSIYKDGLEKTIVIDISGFQKENVLKKLQQELFNFRAFLRIRKLNKDYSKQWAVVKNCIVRRFPNNSLYIYKKPIQIEFQYKKVG